MKVERKERTRKGRTYLKVLISVLLRARVIHLHGRISNNDRTTYVTNELLTDDRTIY